MLLLIIIEMLKIACKCEENAGTLFSSLAHPVCNAKTSLVH